MFFLRFEYTLKNFRQNIVVYATRAHYDVCTCCLQQLIYNINRTISQRLDMIESKLESVQGKSRELEDKVDAILNHMVVTQNFAVAKQEEAAAAAVTNE